LPTIDISGMEGPVQIIPYVDTILTLHLTQVDSGRQAAQKK
jgi:hypothetical protein